MSASAVESIIIHTFMELPESSRDNFIGEIRKLCDTLDLCEGTQMDNIREIILRKQNDQSR